MGRHWAPEKHTKQALPRRVSPHIQAGVSESVARWHSRAGRGGAVGIPAGGVRPLWYKPSNAQCGNKPQRPGAIAKVAARACSKRLLDFRRQEGWQHSKHKAQSSGDRGIEYRCPPRLPGAATGPLRAHPLVRRRRPGADHARQCVVTRAPPGAHNNVRPGEGEQAPGNSGAGAALQKQTGSDSLPSLPVR